MTDQDQEVNLSKPAAEKQNHSGKTSLDLLEQEIVSSSGISWAICKSALRPRQIPCQHPTTQFLQARCPSCHPTNSVKALKANRWPIKLIMKQASCASGNYIMLIQFWTCDRHLGLFSIGKFCQKTFRIGVLNFERVIILKLLFLKNCLFFNVTNCLELICVLILHM